MDPSSAAIEETRTAMAEWKRQQRKERAPSTSTAATLHVCPTCGRHLRARSGLTSHLPE